MAMTDELYGDFEAGVALLEEELDVTLITRSELKGIKKGREEGRRRSIMDVAEARFGSPLPELETALEGVSGLDALTRLTSLPPSACSPPSFAGGSWEACGIRGLEVLLINDPGC